MNSKMNKQENWDDYMRTKKRKLEHQFVNSVDEIDSKQGNIFRGVSIYVNGYTDPPADELKRLMMEYGGVYHHHFVNGKTTYMIASVLPTAKVVAFQHSKTKIIKPEWITDSIRARRMLNYKNYLLLNDDSSCTFPVVKDVMSTDGGEQLDYESSNHGNATTDTFCRRNPDNGNTISTHARDGDFISEFYNNSRLHHLSTMKIRLKTYVRDLRQKNLMVHSYPGIERLRALKISPLENHSSDYRLETTEKCIMHIDLDCFFVSVGIRKRPHLQGLPVAVAHAKNEKVTAGDKLWRIRDSLAEGCANGEDDFSKDFRFESIQPFDSMSEIACCSYKAREFGIKNGMLLGQALKLCPQLKVIPYEFHDYEEVSFAFYKHLTSFTLDIEAVSCDEMFVDCTNVLRYCNVDPLSFATILRNDILEITGCTCSAGFGPNRLISRLATKMAKPNGQLFIPKDQVAEFIKNIPVSQLPGIGSAISRKLSKLGIKSCEDMQRLPLSVMQREFGKKMGSILLRHSFGDDDKDLNFEHQRKSLSADINYGIRFRTNNDVEEFLKKLAIEISNRLNNEKLKGKSITLKLMIKAKDAPCETAKYMGHGICDNVTKTLSLNHTTSNSDTIFEIASKIMRDLSISPETLRGIGIQVSKLEQQNCFKTLNEHPIDRFLVKMVDDSTSVNLLPNSDSNLQRNSETEITHKTDTTNSHDHVTTSKHFKNSSPLWEKMSIGRYIRAAENKRYEFNVLSPIPEVARIAQRWVANELDPQLSDVEMFFSFVKYLAYNNDFESFNFIVDKIDRSFKSQAETKWMMIRNAFIKFVAYVQQSV